MELETFSDSELQAELERRRQVLREEAQREQRAHERMLVTYIDALLGLVPDHSRTSCSDEDANNYHGRCTRCTLMFIYENGYVPRPGIRLNLYLEFPQEEETEIPPPWSRGW